jgi:hypothetical protein
MTAQINDSFQYGDIEYSVAGISAGVLFDPAIFDLKPVMASTACWRGYQVVYSIADTHLIVADLHVNLLEDADVYQRKQGPTINGITPTEKQSEYDRFNNHYYGLNYHLEYSGGLLLADGFIRDLYVHMGFHPAWKYETVIELVFEKGVLSQEFDHSEKMAEVRRRVLESRSRSSRETDRMPTTDEIRNLVERSFDRTYKM